MKPARIVLLLVALVAGLLAAFLVMRGGDSPAPRTVVTEVVREEARTQVLVAKAAIGMGERLTAQTVEWLDWPEGAVRSEYVTKAAMPDAPAELTGAVARFEFFPGEPIREQKLVRTDQGYLSAVLAPGMRGVSVPVDAESSAGGFVVPNDRVDVLLTRSTDAGRISEVVLANVRVLAIGKRLGEVGASGGAAETEGNQGPQAQVFEKSNIATLELTPRQAETLINADSLGDLSLALRSIADFREDPVIAQRQTANQAVRVIRFGRETSVMSGQSSSDVVAQAAPVAPVVPPFADEAYPPVPFVEAPPAPPPQLPEIQVQ
ncbi:Flp pilus assembly protein CpaB [Devosia nitrariae]|uniref:Flp pilus assembly protein CpaB n=1 Tax=Devosia nitrariae TaxID=2071872 RepID=A0ABQ5W0R1_9HYPH|nr:Flp pilus assembly protein CpaB [Devosia nitrariae]GLQ53260.1 Flp pilus assembly protein CpaB [Devosia nitrariae]